MKKRNIMMLTRVLVFSLFFSAPFMAAGKDISRPTLPMSEAKTQAMVLRLQEIKELDMSSLDRTEKRELKSEIREINKELKKNGGGVYLSVGALLVVIILLILLL